MRRRVDRYELLEEVGSGGMAVVYRGRDTALDREVAVKLLHPHLAARAEARARFSREARAVARLSHPNIVEIFDYAGEHAVESYLVTEFVHGRTLRAFAEEVGLGFPEIGALVARALADALVHAHAAGVIHRDLKPENVLVVESGRRAVKLVDFGIARIVAADERMTMTGALVGSPNHMAPEIIEGREADARSDLFSLGTILYWLATGQLPFAAPNPTATLRRVVEGDYRDPREISPLVSDALAEAIARALAVDPDARTRSAAELRDELDAALAEVGLENPDEELAAFLADPAAYRAAFPARLVAALGARGEAALDAGSTARALKLFNRVLAVDPSNARVSQQLARLARRGRIRRSAGWGTTAAAVALLAAGAWLAWTRMAPPPGKPSPAAAPPPAAAASPAAPAASAPELPQVMPAPGASPEALSGEPTPAPAPAAPHGRSAADPGVPPPAPPTAPAAASGPAPTRVTILVRPYAQRALLDGVEVASGAQRVAFTLTPGSAHRIRIEHACCEPFVRDFPLGAALPEVLELRVPLEPRPARLRVEAEPDARVIVDGRVLGTAGESQRRGGLPVPVPATGDSQYEGLGEIRVVAPGRPAHVTLAKIRAGGELTIVAPRTETPPLDAAEEEDEPAQQSAVSPQSNGSESSP